MLEITWLGHGTFQFQIESGEVILLDPWIDGNPSYPKGHKITRLDTMLITHGHLASSERGPPAARYLTTLSRVCSREVIAT